MTENIDLLYDHYKDTYEQIKSFIAKRDENFIVALLFLAGSIFTTFNPAYVQNLSNSIGKVKFGIDLNLAFYMLNSILLFISLWFIQKYYQSVTHIENLYAYIHNVENQLCALISSFQITREGKSYLEYFPHLKTAIQIMYTWVFPISVVVICAIKGYWEVANRKATIPRLALFFDISCIAAIIAVTLLHISWVHFKDFRKLKKQADSK
jgi:hypothetical protein